MVIESKLSAIIANQLGRMQGALEIQVQQQVQTQLSKFKNQCPSPNQLDQVISSRNNLSNVLNLFKNKKSKFNTFISQLQTLISTLKAIITILKLLPIPTSVPPGIGITISQTNTYAELLIDAKRFLEAVEKDIESIKILINSIDPFISTVQNNFNSLDIFINDCVNQLPEQERNQLTKLTQQPSEQNTAGSPQQDGVEQFRADSGADFTIEVVTIQQDRTKAPLRQAIAKNINGVVVLRGQKSYSSSTKVLVDQLKFRINNNLP